MFYSQKRTDQEWLDELRGISGQDKQKRAILELANYLYIVACTYLQKQQDRISGLRWLTNEDLAALGEEFVQRYMEKMIREDFALLEKYSGRGSFLAWAAQVTTNLCGSELRLRAWHRNQPFELAHNQIDSKAIVPEDAALRQQLCETLVHCLAKLPERHRFALLQCVVEGESASEVGQALNISANAVHILVHRAKKMMRKHLECEGIGVEVLASSG